MKRLATILFSLACLSVPSLVQAQDTTKLILEKLTKISEWLDVKDVPPNQSLHADISAIRQQTQGLAGAIAKLSSPARAVYLTTPPGKNELVACSFWSERKNVNAFNDCLGYANRHLTDAEILAALITGFCSHTIGFSKGGVIAHTKKDTGIAKDYQITAAVCSD